MRNTRQQVAGAVLYTLKGQTIQREKAAQIANPRTTAQMDQRVKLANLVNFYRANKAWMSKGAFETKKQTWSDYNAFVSANLEGNNIYLTKMQASEGQCVVAPYIVTKGTLPAIVQGKEGSGAQTAYFISYRATEAPTTWGALSTALISSYPGIQNGDQFSLIRMVQSDENGKYYITVQPFEKNLDTSSETLLSTIFASATFATSGVSLPVGDNALGVCACFSRSVGGSIKVSSASIVAFNDEAISLFSGDSAQSEAIASYGGSSVNFLDNGTSGLSSSAGDSQSGGSGAGDPGDVTP